MKKTALISLCIIGVLIVMISTASAAEAKLGVVNYNYVLSKSKAGQEADVEIKELIKEKQEAAQELAEKVQNLKKELAAVQDDDAKKTKQQELVKAVQDYQKTVAAANSEVRSKTLELRKKILQEIQAIISQIGKEGNYVMIVDTSVVPFYQTAIDLTGEVLKKYDASK